MVSTAKILANIKRQYLHKQVEAGKRADGRGLEDYRPVTVQKNLIDSANGSAMATMGDTKVLCGVKFIMGEPYPDSADRGAMTTNVELAPIAHDLFEAGPPREEAIELARVVDRGIRESGAINMQDLCLIEGEKCWVVFIDLHILDHDGNLIDCATLAAMAALSVAILPLSKHELGEDIPLKLNCVPLTCTYAILNGKLLVDPTYEEEQVMEGRLTVSTDDDDIVRAMQKGIGGAFSPELVKEATTTANKINQPLRKLLEEAK